MNKNELILIGMAAWFAGKDPAEEMRKAVKAAASEGGKGK